MFVYITLNLNMTYDIDKCCYQNYNDKLHDPDSSDNGTTVVHTNYSAT